MAAGVVGVTAWVLWERADANVSAGSSPANAVDTIDSASGRCEVGASTVETWLAVFAVDGVLSTGDVERATALADQGDGDCMKGELEAIACDVLERLLLTSVRPLVREPATLCGGR